MNQPIPELDRKGLRQFGLILAAVLTLVCGVLLPWIWQLDNQPNVFWMVLGGLVAIWAMVAPDTIRGFYHAWMRVAMVIGHVINTLLLACVFFVVVTPMAVIMRSMGKDPMRRRLDPQVNSYRIHTVARHKKHMERPY